MKLKAITLFTLICFILNGIPAMKARAAGSSLSSLSINCGVLSPSFQPSVTSYNAVVKQVQKIIVTAKASDPDDTVTVNKIPCPGNCEVAVPSDSFAITVKVCDANGYQTFYSVNCTVEASASPGLSSLLVSGGSLSPAFSTGVTDYSMSVPYTSKSITVTPTVCAPMQSLFINDSAVSSGSCTPVALNTGENTIIITVKDALGDSAVYTVRATRQSPAAPALSRLALSDAALSPAFSPDIYEYTVRVSSSVTKLTVFAFAPDPAAKVMVNGRAGAAVTLAEGINNIAVTVTLSDGSCAKYSITVYRPFGTKITVTVPDADGVYRAQIPSYIISEEDSADFYFTLGSCTLKIPAASLKTELQAVISCSGPSPAELAAATAASQSNSQIAGGLDIRVSGGGSLNASVTADLSSKELSVLKKGPPVLLYYNEDTMTLENTDAAIDLSSGTVSFSAYRQGLYVYACMLSNPTVKYTLASDAIYSGSGPSKGFHISVTRESGSARLAGAQVMAVTTLKNGRQTYCFRNVAGDTCNIDIPVDDEAVKTAVYLIAGGFDAAAIPKTYALAQFTAAS